MDDDAVREHATLTLPATIRRCRATDLPALEWFGTFTPHRHLIEHAYAMQERGDGVMIVADVNGFPAGQTCVDFVRKRRSRRATLWAVRVFPALHRCGLGSRLIRAAERAVAAHGMATVELGVDRDNLDVLSFYERLGYEPCGTERGHYTHRSPDGASVEVAIDQILLARRLGPAGFHRAAQ